MMDISSYACLVSRVLWSNLRRLHFPYKLTYAITYRCNHRCKTCSIWKTDSQNELQIDEIRAFFRKAKRFLWVDLTGGEVSLRKDFVDICEAILAACPNLLLLHFPTNGYLTDKIVRDVREIAKMKPEKFIITVSTDGDEVTNDRIRGVAGGWKRQMETFRRLREISGVQTILGMTLSAFNMNHLPTAFEAAKREYPWLTYEDYHVNIVHESGHFFSNDDLGLYQEVSSDDLSRAVDRYARLRSCSWTPVSLLETAYLKQVDYYLKTGSTPMRCHALSASCFVDPWGNVFPCTIYGRKIGSLRDVGYNLAKIWTTPESRGVQQEIFDRICPQCWTPCEAYQSILGNLFRAGPTRMGYKATKVHKPS